MFVFQSQVQIICCAFFKWRNDSSKDVGKQKIGTLVWLGSVRVSYIDEKAGISFPLKQWSYASSGGGVGGGAASSGW